MQYLGSSRKLAGFSAGMAGGVFLFHLFLERFDEIDFELLIGAGIAAAAVFAGTLVGTFAWSQIGGWLKKRRELSAAKYATVGLALALGLMGVITVGVHAYFSVGVQHEVAFWLAVSLWNAIGYGLAVAPDPRH